MCYSSARVTNAELTFVIPAEEYNPTAPLFSSPYFHEDTVSVPTIRGGIGTFVTPQLSVHCMETVCVVSCNYLFLLR